MKWYFSRFWHLIFAINFPISGLFGDTGFCLQEDDVRYNCRHTGSGEVSSIYIRLGNIQFIAERQ